MSEGRAVFLALWAAASPAAAQASSSALPDCGVRGEPGRACSRLLDLSRAAAEDLARPALVLAVALSGSMRPALGEAYASVSRLPATGNSGLDGQRDRIRSRLASGLRRSSRFLECGTRLLKQEPLPERRPEALCLREGREAVQDYRRARAGLNGVLKALRGDGLQLPAGYESEAARAARAVEDLPWEGLPEEGRRRAAVFPAAARAVRSRFKALEGKVLGKTGGLISRSLERAEADFEQAASAASERRDSRLISADYWSLLAAYDLREAAAAVLATRP